MEKFHKAIHRKPSMHTNDRSKPKITAFLGHEGTKTETQSLNLPRKAFSHFNEVFGPLEKQTKP